MTGASRLAVDRRGAREIVESAQGTDEQAADGFDVRGLVWRWSLRLLLPSRDADVPWCAALVYGSQRIEGRSVRKAPPPQPTGEVVLSKECVLITGGGSGIGMGLAQAFHARGATVVIAGRNRAALDAVALGHPGMMVEVVDVADPGSVEALVASVSNRHPGLNLLINNAGIQQVLDFAGATPPDIAIIAREIDTNLKGLIHVSAAFLPLLKRQSSARLVHVGSGLAYVPLSLAPVYSATKAAVHSFTISLRLQLAGTTVRVIEILPPVVDTALHRGLARKPPKAMPLPVFVKAAMAGLDAGTPEIVIGLAKVLKVAQRVAPGLFLKVVNKRPERSAD